MRIRSYGACLLVACCLLLACGCGCRCRLWSHVSRFVLCPLVSYIAHSPLTAIRKHIQPHALVAGYQQCYRCCCYGLCISFLFSQVQAIIRSKPMIANARWASAAVMAASAPQPTLVLRPTQLVGLGSGNNHLRLVSLTQDPIRVLARPTVKCGSAGLFCATTGSCLWMDQVVVLGSGNTNFLPRQEQQLKQLLESC